MPRIVVYHAYYGCETGCCGHVIEVDGEERGFHFRHPGDRHPYHSELSLDFAKTLISEQMGEEHVKDLDWDGCTVLED